MSWFNETFGDSLNSIKGQITKITKEVLAEDENEKEEETETIKSKLKELDSLCSSKDLEIASLRDENKKISQRFQEELKFLKNENKKLKADFIGQNENVFLGETEILQVTELKNELHQLKIERDHLEELQKDHQANICLIMQQRDNWKSELEKVKTAYSDLECKYNQLQSQQIDNRITSSFSEVNLLETENKEDDVIHLKSEIEELQTQIELHQQEKEEKSTLIDRLTMENENLREEVRKIIEEIKFVKSKQENVESENCNLRKTIQVLESDLNSKKGEFESAIKKEHDLEEKLKKISDTMENSKMEESNLKQDLDNEVKKLLSIFLVHSTENISLSSAINEIENIWKKNLREKENTDKIHNESINKLQNEIQRLINDKISLEHEIKIGIDKRNELECDYKTEINSLQSKYLELKNQEEDCLIKSQTDDVKRLDQEVSRLMEIIEMRNKELNECYCNVNTVTQELKALKGLTDNSREELLKVTAEKDKLEKSLLELKNNFDKKEKKITETLENEDKIKRKCKAVEDQNNKLLQQNELLQSQLSETVKLNKDLENQMLSLKNATERTTTLQQELEESIRSKSELEKICADMQQVKLNDDKQIEYLKAQLIIKESGIAEASAKNQSLTEQMNQLKEESVRLQGSEEELNKWKEAMIELEMQRQEMSEQKELLEKECAGLGSELMVYKQKADELENVKRENANLIEICNKLQNESQCKIQNEEIKQEEENKAFNHEALSSLQTEIENLRAFGQQQGNIIASLTYENNQLKHHIQMTNDNLAALNEENNQLKQMRSVELPAEDKNMVNLPNQVSKEKLSVQQHKRSKSDFDAGNAEDMDINRLRVELETLKESSQRQQRDYKVLEEQHTLVSEKEAHARKELERLRLHLIEIENYYTETIDEYKTKLNVTEEQLKNSSTIYTSTKVRDNQHLESLQRQIRLISTQRDELQVKLSAAEDEVQKHKAALASFHVVLEQFQQDKEREFESVSAKYENQLRLSERRFAELQQEINSLNGQLNDAKTGLKAASRLGEQLERKTEQISELEQLLTETKNEMKELEERAAVANQSNFGKVDKSLVKNLVLGYISAQKADRKTQVLRIMMSVLDFSEEERSKIGVDNTQSGWLSHLLHPRVDGTQASQSLSEAFIRFLENESRPKPQLKLLPERSPQMDKASTSGSKPQPSLLLQELVLPTFNSPQTNESSILKDVLNDT